jgi:hypothetical protein
MDKKLKNPLFLRGLGTLFVISSIIGIIISLIAIGLIWIFRPKAQTSIITMINITNDTLQTTSESLILMSDVIDLATSNLNIIESTIDELDGTINSISESLDTTASLVGDDLRQTIIDTQTTLSTASTSAKLIDNTLFFLAQVPFIGVDYDPDVPLHTSLLQVSGNLEDIPVSLENMELTLSDAADGLDTLNSNMTSLSTELSQFEMDLVEANDLLTDYQKIIRDGEESIATLRENIFIYTVLFAIVFSLLVLWSLIFHLNMLVHGWQLVKGEQKIVNLADFQRDNAEE